MNTRKTTIFSAKFRLQTLAYAFIFAILLYRNFASITLPLWVIATFFYIVAASKDRNLTLKPGCYAYGTGMFLIACAIMCTANIPIIRMGYLMMIILFISLLLHQFRDDSKWTITKYVLAALELFAGAAKHIICIFTDVDWNDIKRKESKMHNIIYVLVGLLLATPLFLVVAALLCISDKVFANLLNFDTFLFNLINDIPGFNMLFLFALMIPYGILCFLGTGHIDTKPHDYRKGNPVVSITALIPITLLYCVFCGVQFVSLFMKRLPDGYTYSQYAREGFFELLAVCIINVALILIIQEFFQDHLLQKAILTITCLCTYIMLASSAYRILLYINAYGLTFLRIMVIWALIVIALLLLGLMTQIFWRHFPTMRYSIFVVCALYLALAFLHPDYIIADYNLSHDFYDSSYDQTLAQLSDDAAPALFRFYEEDPGQETLYHTYLSFALSHNLDYQDSFMKFNLSHYRAHKAIPPELQEYIDYGL